MKKSENWAWVGEEIRYDETHHLEALKSGSGWEMCLAGWKGSR